MAKESSLAVGLGSSLSPSQRPQGLLLAWWGATQRRPASTQSSHRRLKVRRSVTSAVRCFGSQQSTSRSNECQSPKQREQAHVNSDRRTTNSGGSAARLSRTVPPWGLHTAPAMELSCVLRVSEPLLYSLVLWQHTDERVCGGKVSLRGPLVRLLLK